MEEKEISYINMVPFIDVMLVLLTIILMTSTFVISGLIPVELPKVTGKYENAMRTKIIEIDGVGSIYFQGAAVDLLGLKDKLHDISKDTPFLIRADRRLALQIFVEVLEWLRHGFLKGKSPDGRAEAKKRTLLASPMSLLFHTVVVTLFLCVIVGQNINRRTLFLILPLKKNDSYQREKTGQGGPRVINRKS
jgi:biopolymer transport protein ExbD